MLGSWVRAPSGSHKKSRWNPATFLFFSAKPQAPSLLSHQFDSLFTSQMLNVKANGKHTREAMLNLFLQGFVLIGIVSVAKQSGYGQFLCHIFYDTDSAMFLKS